MFKSSTQNKVGYGVLATGVVLGLFFSWRNDSAIEGVNRRQSELIETQREFILDQCDRDKIKDQVIIEALQDARLRINFQLKNDPALKSIVIARLNEQIAEVKNTKPCKLPEEK